MDTMTTTSSTTTVQTQSYFQKNKKMIFILIFLLLVFCGLMTYIFISNRPAAPVVINYDDESETPEPTPIISSPVVENPAPVPTPAPVTTKTLSFEMLTNDFGADYVPHIGLIVPYDSYPLFGAEITTTSSVTVMNPDYKLTFFLPYEISGYSQYKTDVVKIGNAGGFQNIYRVDTTENTNPLVNMYANNPTIETGSCYSEAIGKPEVQAPCGYPILSNPKGLQVTCEVSDKANFAICDDIVKSMTIENVNK